MALKGAQTEARTFVQTRAIDEFAMKAADGTYYRGNAVGVVIEDAALTVGQLTKDVDGSEHVRFAGVCSRNQTINSSATPLKKEDQYLHLIRSGCVAFHAATDAQTGTESTFATSWIGAPMWFVSDNEVSRLPALTVPYPVFAGYCVADPVNGGLIGNLNSDEVLVDIEPAIRGAGPRFSYITLGGGMAGAGASTHTCVVNWVPARRMYIHRYWLIVFVAEDTGTIDSVTMRNGATTILNAAVVDGNSEGDVNTGYISNVIDYDDQIDVDVIVGTGTLGAGNVNIVLEVLPLD